MKDFKPELWRLNLDTRAFNIFHDLKCNDIHDVLKLSALQLLRARNCGKVTIKLILMAVYNYTGILLPMMPVNDNEYLHSPELVELYKDIETKIGS